MEVKTLSIENFRGIRSLEIKFHDRMNVFIGENGCGKSAILDVLAIMLSRLTGRLGSERKTGRSYSLSDITNGTSRTLNRITMDLNGEQMGWRALKFRREYRGEIRRVAYTTHYQPITLVAKRFLEEFLLFTRR